MANNLSDRNVPEMFEMESIQKPKSVSKKFCVTTSFLRVIARGFAAGPGTLFFMTFVAFGA